MSKGKKKDEGHLHEIIAPSDKEDLTDDDFPDEIIRNSDKKFEKEFGSSDNFEKMRVRREITNLATISSKGKEENFFRQVSAPDTLEATPAESMRLFTFRVSQTPGSDEEPLSWDDITKGFRKVNRKLYKCTY